MAWAVSGNLKGPQGEQGPQGIQGVPGADGAGIEIAGSVATYANLPTTLGPADAGAGYLVQADGKLYIWDGTAFPADGAGVAFRGPQGPEGPQGDQGIQGIQGPEGPKGDTGNTGAAGADGADATVAVGTTTTGAPGSAAAVTNTGTPGAAQFNFTIPRGDVGATGAPGADGTDGTKWFTGSGAPGAVAGSAPGDFYLDSVDGTYYVLE